MQIENLLVGIVLILIGLFGIIDFRATRLKRKEDLYGSNTQLIFGSIGVIGCGLYLTIKEMITLF